VKGGERIRAAMDEGSPPESGGEEIPNPAIWAWNMMAKAGTDAAEAMGRAVEAAGETARDASQEPGDRPAPKSRKKKTAR
jgi:hypothetical protein